MKCPCKNCICLPICKYKPYIHLINDRILVQKFLPNFTDATTRSEKKLLKLYNIIQPARWGIKTEPDSELLGGSIWVTEK